MTEQQMQKEIERLQRMLARFDAMGCWDMVERLRNVLATFVELKEKAGK